MFGYVKPYTPELKVWEQETYRAVYCGLCKQLGRSFGPLSRLTLNYDFTFLALLELSLEEESPAITPQRCIIHPIKKSPCMHSCPPLEQAAHAAVIFLYYKLLDNLSDEPWYKRWAYWLGLLFVYPAYCKAKKQLPQVEKAVMRMMDEQARCESQSCASIDQACDSTAKAMAVILEELSQKEDTRQVLYRFGYLLGRYIYMADALDDWEKDRKFKRYNPLHAAYSDLEEQESLQQHTIQALYMTIGELANTLALLEPGQFGGILSNIIQSGLRNTVDVINLSKKENSVNAGSI